MNPSPALDTIVTTEAQGFSPGGGNKVVPVGEKSMEGYEGKKGPRMVVFVGIAAAVLVAVAVAVGVVVVAGGDGGEDGGQAGSGAGSTASVEALANGENGSNGTLDLQADGLEVFSGEATCSKYHPTPLSPYAKVCSRCTERACLSESDKNCPAGQIYKGQTRSCVPCQQEFRNSINCNLYGASTCPET